MKSKKIITIIAASLIAGTLDILAAIVDYFIQTGKNPEGIFRFIASGVFGEEAFTGNSFFIWAGLFFHFLIAFLFTTIFFFLYPKIKLLHINIFLTAILFGLIVWLIMNFIVVPLSSTPKFPFNTKNAIKAIVILIVMIGLPLSIIFKKYYRKNIDVVN